jgi:hypothetical protein
VSGRHTKPILATTIRFERCSAREIISRIDEISFNSAFISELAAIAFIEQIMGPSAAADPVRALLRARDHQPHRRDQLQLGAAIAFIEQIMGPSAAADPVKRMFLHIINDEALDALGASSKMNNDRTFLEHLRKIGWSAAEHRLESNLRFVGEPQPLTCRDCFRCNTGYSRIRSAYGSVYKTRIR